MVLTASVAKTLAGITTRFVIPAYKYLAQRKKDAESKALQQELAKITQSKQLDERVEQAILTALHNLRANPQFLATLQKLSFDTILIDELASHFAAGEFSHHLMVTILVKADETLGQHSSELHALAALWENAIYQSVGSNPALSNALNLQSMHRIEAVQEQQTTKLDQLQESVQDVVPTLAGLITELKQAVTSQAKIPAGDIESLGTKLSLLRSKHESRFVIGRDMLISGNVEKAEEEFARLIDDLTDFGESDDEELMFKCRLNHSSALVELDRLEEAEAELYQAKALRPDDLRFKRHLATLLMHKGDNEGALKIIRALRILEPSDEKHIYNEAAALLVLERAEELLPILLSNPQHSPEYFSYLAHTHLHLGSFKEAETAARQACELNPENEAGWVALAYSAGFPVVESFGKKVPLGLPDESGISQLTLAIDAATKASHILGTRKKASEYREVQANKIAFQAVLGLEIEALKTAETLRPLDQCSEPILRNLFFLFMRTGEFRCALEAAELLAKADGESGKLAKAQATAALGEHEAALRQVDELLATNGNLFDSIMWLEVACSAYCGSHRPEKALELLTVQKTRTPESSYLYVLFSRAYRELGQEAKAEAALNEGSKVGTVSPQVHLDLGLLHYMQGRWSEAYAEFLAVGGDSTMSPVFGRTLVAAFNCGEYQATRRMIDSWMQFSGRYEEVVWSIRARMSMMDEDMPKARSLLEDLLREGASNPPQIRRMLASVFSRLDELEEAYALLSRLTVETPDDAEAWVLLGQVSAARGRHLEAVEFARKATDLAPDNIRIRGAFLGIVLAVPGDVILPPKSVEEHHKNIAVLAAHPDGPIRAIHMGDSENMDLTEMRKLLEKKEAADRKVLEIVGERPWPLNFTARNIGTPLYDIWLARTEDPARKVHCCSGTHPEQEKQLKLLSETEEFVMDFVAFCTLQALGLVSILRQWKGKIFVHINTFEAVASHLRDLRDYPSKGRIGSANGQLYFLEADPVRDAAKVKALTEIRDVMKAAPVVLVGVARRESSRFSVERDAIGSLSIAPLEVAVDRDVPIYSDEFAVREIGRLRSEVNGFCTQAFLRRSLSKGLMNQEEYQDALLKLFSLNYHFVSHDSRTLQRLYDTATETLPILARALLNAEGYTGPNGAHLNIAADCIKHIWLSSPKGRKSRREAWLSEIWSRVASADKDGELLADFVLKLAIGFGTMPKAFHGAIQWAKSSVPAARSKRHALTVFALEASRAVGRILSAEVGKNSQLAKTWRRETQISERLYEVLWS